MRYNLYIFIQKFVLNLCHNFWRFGFLINFAKYLLLKENLRNKSSFIRREDVSSFDFDWNLGVTFGLNVYRSLIFASRSSDEFYITGPTPNMVKA